VNHTSAKCKYQVAMSIIVAGTRQPLRPKPPSARPIRETAATKNSADMPVATAAGTQLEALRHTDVIRFGITNSLPCMEDIVILDLSWQVSW